LIKSFKNAEVLACFGSSQNTLSLLFNNKKNSR